jgi:hypothetical protein
MAKKSTRTRRGAAKKTVGQSTRKRRPVRKPAAGSLPKVRVRMYRQGLGDCFLITFDAGGDERHMMIDCGTLGATTTGVKLSDAVADIRAITGGHLHVLIATHEHWDHVAAFDQLQTEFKAMTIDHVWLAWTEDPADPLAQKVAKTKKDLGAALAEVASAALTSPAASPDSKAMGEAVASVLGFFDDSSLGAGQFSETVDKAMEFVRTGVGKKARYCRPGDGPFEESWLPGFRIFVLGPPRDEDALYNLGEHGSSELYSLAAGLRPAARLFMSGQPARFLQVRDATERRDFTAELPFDVRFRREADAAATKEMFGGTYLAAGTDWRRVDEDWLHVASDLALQLDSATNNTSLALAIERVADGKVLLFPADAQQGNWLSWHDAKLQWKVKDGNTSRTVAAADLLARTVFYKVGHHSSHNATARGKGLELMEQENELTAFIPVDRAVALKRNPKGSWKMPALALYRRLLEKCQGRVVRSDLGWASDPATAADKATEKEFARMATAAEWKKWGKAQQAATHVTITKTFVDFVLK